MKQMFCSDPIEFHSIGGYDFAHTYIEFLDETFGWDKILNFVETLDYYTSFGMSEEAIHDGWLEYLRQNYV